MSLPTFLQIKKNSQKYPHSQRLIFDNSNTEQVHQFTNTDTAAQQTGSTGGAGGQAHSCAR